MAVPTFNIPNETELKLKNIVDNSNLQTQEKAQKQKKISFLM